MRLPSLRTAWILIAISSLVFLMSLAIFCLSLGLDLTNEGWDGRLASEGMTATDRAWMGLSLIGFAISIVMFFVGMHRVSKPMQP